MHVVVEAETDKHSGRVGRGADAECEVAAHAVSSCHSRSFEITGRSPKLMERVIALQLLRRKLQHQCLIYLLDRTCFELCSC